MTTLENIRLCDNGYTLSYRIRQDQKIKLRRASRATISSVYTRSLPKTEPIKQNSDVKVPTNETTEVKEIIIIHPLLAKMYEKASKGEYKAIKVKKPMYDNITTKGANVEAPDNVVEKAQTTDIPVTVEVPNNAMEESEKNDMTVAENDIPTSDTTPVENDRVEEQVTMEGSVQQVELPQEDVTKVSRNGAFAAKVEKYMASVNEEVVTDENQVTNEENIVSPTVIEEENARPVSIVAPERTAEETTKENDLNTELNSTLNPENITSVVVADLGQLKEYLAKITELKRIAAKAKEQELAEKEAAERAEQEAVTTRDTLQKTAEELAAHQKALIEQTEASQAQANLYATQRDEYLAERDEYAAAINDMLAVMGNENTVSASKGRGM